MNTKARSRPEKMTDGRIAAIRSGVVDVAFSGPVFRIHDLLDAGDVALEVSGLIGGGIVGAIAMAPVRGLGMTVKVTGGPIQVPLGDPVLGQMLDVFGAPIDGRPTPAAVERRSIHRPPLKLSERVCTPRFWKPASRQLIFCYQSNAVASRGYSVGSVFFVGSANDRARPKNFTARWVRPVYAKRR